LFALQAVGLEKNGCGFLFASPSGWQKTAACRALLRAGYRSLSGRAPLLRQSRAGLELLEVNHPSKSIPQSALGSITERRKRAAPCRPRFLILPQAADWPQSSLEPLPRSRALEELLSLTMVRRHCQLQPSQFRLLARLVEEAACYRLHCGEDVSALPALLDELLLRRASRKQAIRKKI
jgi:hypothetical protein